MATAGSFPSLSERLWSKSYEFDDPILQILPLCLVPWLCNSHFHIYVINDLVYLLYSLILYGLKGLEMVELRNWGVLTATIDGPDLFMLLCFSYYLLRGNTLNV